MSIPSLQQEFEIYEECKSYEEPDSVGERT
jgi:hypothetical protein